eukprot:744488-Pyramimonas_sp.AAC.1
MAPRVAERHLTGAHSSARLSVGRPPGSAPNCPAAMSTLFTLVVSLFTITQLQPHLRYLSSLLYSPPDPSPHASSLSP